MGRHVPKGHLHLVPACASLFSHAFGVHSLQGLSGDLQGNPASLADSKGNLASKNDGAVRQTKNRIGAGADVGSLHECARGDFAHGQVFSSLIVVGSFHSMPHVDLYSYQ